MREEEVYDLNKILLSKRGFSFYLEHCRVEREGDRVVFKKAREGEFASYNLPYANTSILILGKGTSITDGAMFLLSRTGTSVCFAGGGGLPLYAGEDPAFLALEPVSEYRPTKYMQGIARNFFDEAAKVEMAKRLIEIRIDNTLKMRETLESKYEIDVVEEGELSALGEAFRDEARRCGEIGQLMAAEGRYTRKLYALYARTFLVENFVRERGDAKNKSERSDHQVNDFLDHLNYIAYGAATTALHALGVSFSFPMLHGRTSRGGLVFDIADLFKDGLTVPLAFYCDREGISHTEAKGLCLKIVHEQDVISRMIEGVKEISGA